LAHTVVREEEWRERECHNDGIQWGTEANGWEVTPPVSPVPHVDSVGVGSWPGVTAEQLAQAGTWPTEEEYLDEGLAERVQVEVSVRGSVGPIII
jgi:hypothetical protein